VTADGRAKLIDLGVPETKPDADRELLIKEMEFVAPEIIKGEDVDNRADIYSLGKIMEFIGERNISKQFGTVATHCTQFSREQRYDSVNEVRAAITKSHSIVKIIIAAAVLLILAVLAIIYVPKIKANVEKERAERLAHDFTREVDKMQAELPQLCEKYALDSLNEPIVVDWSEDSLKLVETLMPYLSMDDYKDKAMKVLEDQSIGIINSRLDDFDSLLLKEFKTTGDTVAEKIRKGMPEATNDVLLQEAKKWYATRH
jgi:serine/threonine protein kinase